ncbi:MAG: cytochrome C [Deltaproteobacteria bacterium]|nr:cytochrome C [Deltaproteobacteria bacterium]
MGKKAGVLVLLVTLVMFCGNVRAEKLLDSDCIKCHKVQPATIADQGGKHKTEVDCVDCHTQHPPEGKEAVPACSVCHSGKSHYDLENCAACHSDTHAPMTLKIEGDVTDPCLTCHEGEGKQLKDHPSAHTDLACNECHTEHRLIPECMECHEKHSEDMDLKSCLICHPVHMPLVITYDQNLPSNYCAACHGEAAALLNKNTTKHKDLSCVYCHRVQHKTVPTCVSCKIPHGEPHPPKMLAKYPECGQCHGIAHDIRK